MVELNANWPMPKKVAPHHEYWLLEIVAIAELSWGSFLSVVVRYETVSNNVTKPNG